MPQQYVSLMDQLKPSDLLNDDRRDNYEPVRALEQNDIAIDGSTPVDVEMNDWTEPANSPVKTVGAFEIVLQWAAATVNLATFANLAALTNGIDIKIRKGGVLVNLGNVKSLYDFFNIFDVVTITSDTQATPNHQLKARMEFAEQDGMFIQLIDNTLGSEDACITTVNDDIQTLTFGQMNISGYGYVPKS